MTYIVNDKCIKCKLMDCVEVCPVDCFYEGENMLVIKPDECIDCGVCEPECPIDAIEPDTKENAKKWIKINKEYGITLLVIEHNMRVIMSLAQKIFCLAHGQMLADGTPEQIKNDKRVIDAYLGAQ